MQLDHPEYPRLLFASDFNDQAAFEMPLKGWASLHVETEPGVRYSVYVIDPVRLQQDLAEIVKWNTPCFAKPGLVVVPEVTVAAIEQAIRFLHKTGFFSSLKPE